MKKAKKKVRTTAERRRAAKNGWQRRRLRKAALPTSVVTEPVRLKHGNGTDFAFHAEVAERIKTVFEWALERGADPTTIVAHTAMVAGFFRDR